MKIPNEVAHIIRRLAYEIDRYEVHLSRTVRSGPHAEECAILFDLVTDWHDNGVEG